MGNVLSAFEEVSNQLHNSIKNFPEEGHTDNHTDINTDDIAYNNNENNENKNKNNNDNNNDLSIIGRSRFHTKFHNITKEVIISELIMVSLKMSGSLISIFSSDGKKITTTTKNSANFEFCDLFEKYFILLFKSLYFEKWKIKYGEFVKFIFTNNFSFHFEFVTQILGDHGEIPLLNFISLLNITNENDGTPLSIIDLSDIAVQWNFVIPETFLLSKEKCEELIEMRNNALLRTTTDFISFLRDNCVVEIKTSVAHSELQGEVLEGIVMTSVALEDQGRFVEKVEEHNKTVSSLLEIYDKTNQEFLNFSEVSDKELFTELKKTSLTSVEVNKLLGKCFNNAQILFLTQNKNIGIVTYVVDSNSNLILLIIHVKEDDLFIEYQQLFGVSLPRGYKIVFGFENNDLIKKSYIQSNYEECKLIERKKLKSIYYLINVYMIRNSITNNAKFDMEQFCSIWNFNLTNELKQQIEKYVSHSLQQVKLGNGSRKSYLGLIKTKITEISFMEVNDFKESIAVYMLTEKSKEVEKMTEIMISLGFTVVVCKTPKEINAFQENMSNQNVCLIIVNNSFFFKDFDYTGKIFCIKDESISEQPKYIAIAKKIATTHVSKIVENTTVDELALSLTTQKNLLVDNEEITKPLSVKDTSPFSENFEVSLKDNSKFYEIRDKLLVNFENRSHKKILLIFVGMPPGTGKSTLSFELLQFLADLGFVYIKQEIDGVRNSTIYVNGKISLPKNVNILFDKNHPDFEKNVKQYLNLGYIVVIVTLENGYDVDVLKKRINERTPNNTDSSLIGSNFEDSELEKKLTTTFKPKLDGIENFDNLIKIKFNDDIGTQVLSILNQLSLILKTIDNVEKQVSKKGKTGKPTYFGIFGVLEKHVTVAYYGNESKYKQLNEFKKFNDLEKQVMITYFVKASDLNGKTISFYVVEIIDEEIRQLQKQLLNKELNHITMVSDEPYKPALSGEIHKLISVNMQNDILIVINGVETFFNITYDLTKNGEILTGVFGESN
jgi:hypothetical protein